MLAVHFLQNAMVTVLLSQRRISPASETKLGKAPKDVEFVGERATPLPLMQLQRAVEVPPSILNQPVMDMPFI